MSRMTALGAMIRTGKKRMTHFFLLLFNHRFDVAADSQMFLSRKVPGKFLSFFIHITRNLRGPMFSHLALVLWKELTQQSLHRSAIVESYEPRL